MIDYILFQYDELLKRHTTFEKAEQEKATLEKIILKLKGQLNDLERIDLERQHLQDKLTALQDELKLTVSRGFLMHGKNPWL